MSRARVEGVLLTAVLLTGCGDDSPSSGADASTVSDTGVIASASCETLGVSCGWQVDGEGNNVFCGRCRWSREILPVEGEAVTMDVADNDRVDVLLFDRTGLLHATRSPDGMWSHQLVEEVDVFSTHRFARLARSNDSLWAVFGAPENQLFLAEYDGTAWTIHAFGEGQYADIAATADGKLHVVWSSTGKLQYAVGAPDAWAMNEIAERAQRLSVAVDSAGTAHVAWADTTRGLHYASGGIDGWSAEQVADDSNGGSAARPVIRLDNAGAPWIGQAGSDHERVLRRAGASWSQEIIDTSSAFFPERLSTAHLDFQLGPRDQPQVLSGISAGFSDDSFVLSVPGESGWQRQVIWPSASIVGESSVALGVFSNQEPVALLANASDKIAFMTVVGVYSGEHAELCQTLAVSIYDDACACDSSCCTGSMNSPTSSCCTGAGCSGDVRAMLCSDPTAEETLLESCAAMVDQSVCVASTQDDVEQGLGLPEACLIDRMLR